MRPPESFVEQPIRSLQTMLRVLAEEDGKLVTVVPDGIYGPATMQAVTTFQRKNNIAVTGIVDQQTWETITAAYENAIIRIGNAEPIEIIMDPGQVFHAGDTHPYIYLLQSMLTQLSFDHPSIAQPEHTGILDEITAESLRNFQKIAGLPETGELDKITWKHIAKQYSLSVHHYNIQNT